MPPSSQLSAVAVRPFTFEKQYFLHSSLPYWTPTSSESSSFHSLNQQCLDFFLTICYLLAYCFCWCCAERYCFCDWCRCWSCDHCWSRWTSCDWRLKINLGSESANGFGWRLWNARRTIFRNRGF